MDRASLIEDLRKQGICRVEARRLIDVVINAIAIGLRRDGNVEMSCGRLYLKPTQLAHNLVRNGKLIPLNRKRWRVMFEQETQ